mmetsp:Transcript_16081/g.34779  ORF Transcript_16081/g.34779 Transcript_16081/m.34779 type:complete len:660 (-) Transcript_16081:631-2610(-)|eukprot:CAMPEP_0202898180 /NCGR_PEP_ID=MMETSP1392-20130828/6765_1 /ASSEMBLY_ACC=CAM_ASM_000868 /TAXON_ID=225041 /ORGANISM="Chlamydomonas chlamydogama, Strain SAG 11-48b" /LENGTH=659 /DNA_ID=CAMNT_0049584033 /DNA_START=27 /DNA_END=2006 /DNA_ORIENTATION=-
MPPRTRRTAAASKACKDSNSPQEVPADAAPPTGPGPSSAASPASTPGPGTEPDSGATLLHVLPILLQVLGKVESQEAGAESDGMSGDTDDRPFFRCGRDNHLNLDDSDKVKLRQLCREARSITDHSMSRVSLSLAKASMQKLRGELLLVSERFPNLSHLAVVSEVGPRGASPAELATAAAAVTAASSGRVANFPTVRTVKLNGTLCANRAVAELVLPTVPGLRALKVERFEGTAAELEELLAPDLCEGISSLVLEQCTFTASAPSPKAGPRRGHQQATPPPAVKPGPAPQLPPQLTRLRLTRISGVKLWTTLPQLSQLQQLELRAACAEDQLPRQLALLQPLTSLTSLTVHPAERQQYAVMFGMAAAPPALPWERCSAGLNALGGLVGLRHLDVALMLDDEGMEAVRAMKQLSSLHVQGLDLKVPGPGLDSLEVIKLRSRPVYVDQLSWLAGPSCRLKRWLVPPHTEDEICLDALFMPGEEASRLEQLRHALAVTIADCRVNSLKNAISGVDTPSQQGFPTSSRSRGLPIALPPDAFSVLEQQPAKRLELLTLSQLVLSDALLSRLVYCSRLERVLLLQCELRAGALAALHDLHDSLEVLAILECSWRGVEPMRELGAFIRRQPRALHLELLGMNEVDVPKLRKLAHQVQSRVFIHVPR